MVAKQDLDELLALAKRLHRERLPYRTGYRRFRTAMLIRETELMVSACYALDRFYRAFGSAYVV